MTATTSPAQGTSPPDALPVWTFADLVSSRWYWVLLIAYALIGIAMSSTRIMNPYLFGRGIVPLIAIEFGAPFKPYIMAVILMAAAVSSSRGIKWILVFLSALGAIAVLCLLQGSDPHNLYSYLFLLLGLLILYLFLLTGWFPLAVILTNTLVIARSNRFDILAGFSLLVMTASLLVRFGNMGVYRAWETWRYGTNVDLYLMLGCFLFAAVVLLLTRPLAFDRHPRVRHAPLARRYRSKIRVMLISLPLVIGVVLLTFVLVKIFFLMKLPMWRWSWLLWPRFEWWFKWVVLTQSALFLILCSLVYIGYWCYRIHGELAGQAPSQHLLIPVAATLMAMLVPLALPILLITLGRIVNTRGATVSIGWLAFWSLLMPPIAMGMIQNAANAQ